MLIPRACLVKTITCPLGVHIEVVFTLHVCSAFLEGLCSQFDNDNILMNCYKIPAQIQKSSNNTISH